MFNSLQSGKADAEGAKRVHFHHWNLETDSPERRAGLQHRDGQRCVHTPYRSYGRRFFGNAAACVGVSNVSFLTMENCWMPD
jgi:hypothetical protein